MRLHSNTLTESAIRAALQHARHADRVSWSVGFMTLDPKGSRKRARAWEIRLDAAEGDGHRHTNTGTYGAGTYYAATWDEWGWFMSGLFDMDPDAIFGYYNGREDFHAQTRGKFVTDDDARYECDGCGRIGNRDDGIAGDGDECPDEACGGIVHVIREAVTA